jgi:hypothetical protein
VSKTGVELKQLDECAVARRRSESTIPCNQRSSEFFGKHDVGREIVTQLPTPWHENDMGIPSNAEIQQIADRLVGTVCWDHSLLYKTPQHLGDLKIEEVRCVKGFVTRINSLLNALVLRKNSICAVIVMLFDGWLQVLEILVGQKPAVVVGFEPM